jgi:16S rRNA processing protein RimM
VLRHQSSIRGPSWKLLNKSMDLLEIGKIVKPVGFKGRMKVASYIESPHVLESLQGVFVQRGDRSPNFYQIKDITVAKKSFSLQLDGIENSDMVEPFVGCHVLISSDKLDPLPEGEYYWRDIIGLEVLTEDGEMLGKIASIIPTGSNDVYVCTGGEREILIPAIEDVIKEIDLSKGIIIVELLEGL